jgi:hypothetical protein
MNPDIVAMMQGEDDSLILSEHERALLESALDLYGPHLSSFLLTGLGEDTMSRRRRFTVTFADATGTSYKRDVRVVAYERGGIIDPRLPRLKEPLIMLALLRLLTEDRKLSDFQMAYEQEEVLGLLGWEVTQESRLALDEAVRRYNSLHYEWSLGKEELAAKGLAFYEGEASFISGYAYEEVEADGESKRASSEVSFAEEFVRELLERKLFGINWDDVGTLEYIDY